MILSAYEDYCDHAQEEICGGADAVLGHRRHQEGCFCGGHGLNGDMCGQSDSGFPIPRVDMRILDEAGTRIGTGDGPAPSLFTVDHGIIEYYSSDGLLYGAVEAEEDVLSKTFDPGPGAVSVKVLRRGKEKKIS